jgi:hypothetical protein
MLRRVTLVRADASEELSAFFVRVTRIGELGTLAVTFLRSVRRLLVTANFPSSPIIVTLMMQKTHYISTAELSRLMLCKI